MNSGFNTQGRDSIAIGVEAGRNTQGERSIAIGYQAGFTGQQNSSIAMGFQAGYTGQGIHSIAVGDQAGYLYQGQNSIAIGYQAGKTNQASNSVSIGTNSHSTLSNQICLGSSFDTVYMSNPVISLTNNKSYLTIPDCGVYMYNGGQIYPIYKSTPSFVNFLNCDPSGGSVNAAQGVGGTGGTGSYNKLDIADIDDRYIVHPGYGVIIYDTLNYDGTEFLNYENLTTNINFLGPTSPNRGASARIYYNGVEITSY